MKRLRVTLGMVGLALAPLSLVGLGACVGTTVAGEAARPVPPAASGVAAIGETVTLGGARAFAAAELTYITAADGIGRLARAGVIRGTLATRIRGLNSEAGRLLVAGKKTVDAAEKARLAAELFGISDRLDALTGRK